MSTEVLVLDGHADIYASELRRVDSRLLLHTARDLNNLPSDVSRIEVLLAFGIAVNDDLIKGLSSLRWIQSLASGVDHFLRCPSLRSDVLITSGRGIHGPPMREIVAYFLLSLSQNARQRNADQQQHHWQRRLWSLLAGKTAAVVGLGVSGEAIGGLLKAFGMRVIGVSRAPRALAGFDEVVTRDRLRAVIAQADYVINVLPASEQDKNLFDKSMFEAMKPTAHFINVGRGATVDEPALIEALRNKRIAGAGLDVFAAQPLPKESPLWDMPNVIITPQVGGYVVEYEEYIMPLIIENMRLFLEGRSTKMRNIVAR